MAQVKRKACLICIDGWGVTDKEHGNAIMKAKTPVMDALCDLSSGTAAHVDASGLSVGLPVGVMGNSEVGHLTIGAGQCDYQDLVRINLSIEDGTFGQKEGLQKAFQNAKSGNGRLHLCGLVSDGGVHSHQNHLYKLLEVARDAGVPETFVQVFTDGRDTAPTSGKGYVSALVDKMAELKYGSIGMICGRYYAMDRDKRWERVQLAYEGLVQGKAEVVPDALTGIQSRYDKKETDEFLKPMLVNKDATVRDGDTMLFFDFRADRMREIVEAFAFEPPFDTDSSPKDVLVVGFTRYKSDWTDLACVFPPQQLTNVLSEWISKQGLKQFHTAETEKYAHVTFFFNGGREEAFEGEDRDMVPSPKVATYDLQPEMNAKGVADSVIGALEQGDKYSFVMCNFAPPDMVGHTGEFDACVTACTVTDVEIGRILEACKKNDYAFFLTSDHGNAELMIDDAGNPVTKHSTNDVPFVMGNANGARFNRKAGTVRDVAPTILNAMGLEVPAEMTGNSFL